MRVVISRVGGVIEETMTGAIEVTVAAIIGVTTGVIVAVTAGIDDSALKFADQWGRSPNGEIRN
jgi:hypothetical protein